MIGMLTVLDKKIIIIIKYNNILTAFTVTYINKYIQNHFYFKAN